MPLQEPGAMYDPTAGEQPAPGEDMDPLEELELVDLQVRDAELDEQETMEDPEVEPRDPDARSEAVTDEEGMPTRAFGLERLNIGADVDDVL